MTVNQSKTHWQPRYTDRRPLPASYMSEHPVLGLVVGEINRAIEILSGNSLHVAGKEFGAELEIFGPAQLPDMVRILTKAGIDCSICEVIDSVHQGG